MKETNYRYFFQERIHYYGERLLGVVGFVIP